MPLHIAHISDLHFAKISFDLRQFLSKRWLGNLNLAMFRQHWYQTEHFLELSHFFKESGVAWICLTGDVASTSLDEEFLEAADFTHTLPAPVLIVPGNHDVYTREAEREKRFYHFFPNEEMKESRVSSKALGKNWWWIGLDCAWATSVLYSNGCFFPEMEKALEKTLANIPSDGLILMANHFPLFRSGRPRHDLARSEQLQAIVRNDKRIKLYLHGHDHKAACLDRAEENYPLSFNCGSLAPAPGGTFSLIDLEEKGCVFQQARLIKQKNGFSWTLSEKRPYFFRQPS